MLSPRIVTAVALVLALAACEREASTPAPAAPTAARAPAEPAPPREPVQDALEGGPYPALLVTQAQFEDRKQADGSTTPVPGPARLQIVRDTGQGWTVAILEDPDSAVFHKALPWDGGILTIGATEARLKVWRFAGGAWTQETHWNPTFGGKFDRLRDVEVGDVDGDGKDELVIATHDEGVIAVVHPDEAWRVDEIDRTPRTFVHEIAIGDVDGDGVAEFFATPSRPNKLDEEQPGEVTMYRRRDGGWAKSIVDAPGDTHAKEILAADTDGDGTSELFVVWEGAIGEGGTVVRPVTIKQYRLEDGEFVGRVAGTVPDRQMRAIAAGDVNGDGAIDLVAGALASGLWLFEQKEGTWISSLIDAASAGFEHPVHLADLDGDGALEVYAAAENQGELRRYRWRDGAFQKDVLAPLRESEITWNIADGRF
jgi:hypothetical protein